MTVKHVICSSVPGQVVARQTADPHQYKVFFTFGSHGKGREEFDCPCSIAVSERTGNIAVADYSNKRVQMFDCDWKYLTTLTTIGKGWTSKKIGKPSSVAFSASDDVIITHGDKSRKMSVFSQSGQFIQDISLSKYFLDNPLEVFVTTDGHIVVCDEGDNRVKVFSPEGTKLLQSFSAPDCDGSPRCVVYHQDRFFVSFDDCVKVFSKNGVFLYDIGSEGSDDGQFYYPAGLAIDKFNNLIIGDDGNSRLLIFSLDGEFVNSVEMESRLQYPASVAVTEDGHVLVCDSCANCIYVLQ